MKSLIQYLARIGLIVTAFHAGAQSGDCRSMDVDPCADVPPQILESTPSGTVFETANVQVVFDVVDDFRHTLSQTGDPVTATGPVVETTTLSGLTNYQASRVTTNLQFSVAGTAVVTVRVCDDAAQCTTRAFSYTYAPPVVVVVDRAAPVVTAPYFGDRRPISPDSLSLTYAPPAYTSLDVPRAVSLFYTTERAAPDVFIQLDLTDPSVIPAHAFSLVIQDAAGNPLSLSNGMKEVFYAGSARTGDAHRVAALVRTEALPTGVQTWYAVARSWWVENGVTTSKEAARVPLRVITVNESGSALGAGWSVVGASTATAQPGGMLIVSAGEATFYAQRSCWTGTAGLLECVYDSPLGDTRAVRSIGTRTTRTSIDGLVETFQNGRITSVATRTGMTTGYSYDASGRVVGVLDPAGKLTRLTYDTRGKLASMVDPAGRTSTFTVDAAGDLTRIVGVDGSDALVVTYQTGYHLHMPLQWTDDIGTQRNAAYSFRAQTSVTSSAIPLFNGTTAQPRVTFGPMRAQVLGASGQGTSIAAPLPRKDPALLRRWMRDALGNITYFRSDRFGYLTEVTGPLGHRITIQRDARGLPLSVSDSSGGTVSYQWNTNGLPTYVTDHTAGTYTSYTYDGAFPDLPTRIIESGSDSYYFYGPFGELREVRLSDPISDPVVTYTYDATYRVKRVTSAGGAYVDYSYDGNTFMNVSSRLHHPAVGPDTIERFSYDAHGRVQSFTDREGRVTSYEYDALNRVRSLTVDGRSTTTEFGPNWTRYRDALGFTYEQRRNAVGWVESEVQPDGRVHTYRYDVAGNLRSETGGRGLTVQYTYDAARRVKTRTADGATTTYTYDNPKGDWVRISNAEATEERHFDSAGRVTREVHTIGGTVYDWVNKYDWQGKRSALELSSPWVRTIGWKHSAGDRLVSLAGIDGATTTLEYDGEALPWRRTLPGGIVVTETRNANELLEGISYSGALNVAFGATYTYDTVQRLSGRTDAPGTALQNQPATWWSRAYAYDAYRQLRSYQDTQYTQSWTCTYSGRLVPVCGLNTTGNAALPVTYGYDANGNRTDGNAAFEASSNRVSTFRGYTLRYDADGNLVSKSGNGITQTFTWNALRQMTSSTTNGVRTDYGYSGTGRRVRTTSQGISTYSIYDGDDLFLEVAGTVVREYVMYPGTDRPHSVRHWSGGVASGTYYYATDASTDVSGLHDSAGRLLNRYRYTPYGERLEAQETVVNPLQYRARERDAGSGLYYVRARWYDAQLGRFLSEDPAGVIASAGLYSFAANDPVNKRDTSGRSPECIFGEPTDEDRAKIAAGTHQLCLDPLVVTPEATDVAETDPNGGGGFLPPHQLSVPQLGPPQQCSIYDGGPTIRAQTSADRMIQRQKEERCRSAVQRHARMTLLMTAATVVGASRAKPATMPTVTNTLPRSGLVLRHDAAQIGAGTAVELGPDLTTTTALGVALACHGVDMSRLR